MTFQSSLIGRLRENKDSGRFEVQGINLRDQIDEMLAQVAVNSEEDVKVLVIATTDEDLIDWANNPGKNGVDLIASRWIEKQGFKVKCPRCGQMFSSFEASFNRQDGVR